MFSFFADVIILGLMTDVEAGPMDSNKKRGRFLCVHGHFYQPPRENPWTGRIEKQKGADPFRDWNEKIAAQAYTPNANARILDGEIARTVNNYTRMSFDFGPTLLRWLEVAVPQTYQAILQADRESQALFSGHGSALAQAYHHSILPLCNKRDKFTEIRWGRRDFEMRFGRSPEGMWLAEAAVDFETLEILSEQGIAFTILSPFQANRVLPQDGKDWIDVAEGNIDPRRAYKVELPSGRVISVFFYNKSISQAVAFEGLLGSGELFAKRLLGDFSENSTAGQLVHIATDGETYGHHHKFGEMALAFALAFIETRRLAQITVYGEFLERCPPTDLVEIREKSSWSCHHGVERWRSNCGCQTGGESNWDQKWRRPLRAALNWLRDQTIVPYARELGLHLKDPWAARDSYIEVIVNPAERDHFFAQHSVKQLGPAERDRAMKLLELQRNALMMFTSCGWFFNDIRGIETIQILKYAGRAMELGKELFDSDWERPFLQRLSKAKSNVPEEGDGAKIYRKYVRR